jgi:hypothetical protein
MDRLGGETLTVDREHQIKRRRSRPIQPLLKRSGNG